MLQRAHTLGLDQGDPIVRRRLLHKMRELAGLGPSPSDDDIAAYFAEHSDEFVLPERIDMDVVAVPAETEASVLLRRLNTGEPPNTLGRPTSHGLRQRAVTESQLRGRLGVQDTSAVSALPLNQWSIVEGHGGTYVIRVVKRQGEKQALISDVKGRIIETLTSQRRQKRIDAYEAELEKAWAEK